MDVSMIAFAVLTVLAIGSGLGVILNRKPVVSAFCLAINLVSIAGFYLLLSAQFAALLQVIVYAGAILVLILFVVMLLNLADESTRMGTRPIQLGLGALGAIVLAAFLGRVFWKTSGSFEAAPEGFGTVGALGTTLFTTYFYPFEAISLLLIVAMIGAVLLAKKRL